MAGITRFGVPLLFREYSQERKEYIKGIWIDGKGDCIVEKDGSIVEVSRKSISQFVCFDEEGMKVWERDKVKFGEVEYEVKWSGSFQGWVLVGKEGTEIGLPPISGGGKVAGLKKVLMKKKKQTCEKEIRQKKRNKKIVKWKIDKKVKKKEV